jgi:imidazolonepropionase-like amidohydrolase
MNRRLLFGWIVAAAVAFSPARPEGVKPASMEGAAVYAIKGAKIVTAAGAPIASGTIVIRRGIIEAVGADAPVPADAVVIEGAGMTVYPGLIDMGNTAGVDPAMPAAPANFRTTEDAERFRRSTILRADLDVAEHVRPDAPELTRLASSGITTILATPPGGIIQGRSALVNVAAPPDEPQIGSVADPRKGLQIVRPSVALHVDFNGRGGGGGYPVSLMGAIAFVRQSFYDAQHHQLEQQRFDRLKTAESRPIYDPSLDAMQPALAGRLPVAFDADLAREIVRSLAMAKQFKLDPVITGAREADQVAADLKSQNARVIYSLNFPTRSRMLPPDADEPARELRTRANAPKVPAALDKAGIVFAFSSSGAREPRDFVRNAARSVKEGLPADAAIRALTINAARIAGAADRLGSLEKGKLANVVVTEGELFDEKMRIRHVFVEGRPVPLDDTPPSPGRGRSGQ